MSLTDEDVTAILELLDASGFNEMQLETGAFRLALRRQADGWTREETVVSTGAILTSPVEGDPVDDAAANSRASAGVVDVRTPLPGIFYHAPKPGSPPFVQLGSRVDPDTVVGIVETMKLMNSILAGERGRVVEICVADGAAAAQNSVVMRIEAEQ